MVFSGGVPWNPPLCTNGSAGYLMQLSVKKVVRVGPLVLAPPLPTVL